MTAVSFFEKLHAHYDNELPFVVYRKPGETEVKALLQKIPKVINTTEFEESGFVFTPFDNTKPAILFPLEDSEVLSIKTIDTGIINQSNKKDKLFSEDSLNKKEYKSLIKQALKVIGKNVLRKVVLSRKEVGVIDELDLFKTFQNLLNLYDKAFVYLWHHPIVGTWMGASPETLMSIQGKRLMTMSLAGTQDYQESKDVVWKDKEILEQHLVTEDILQSLEPFTNNIVVGKTNTVRAGNLLHLQTKVTARLKNNDLKGVLGNLHPTPAVCGLPRSKAKDFIMTNEKYNREFYTGFLGELNLREKTTRNSNRKNTENSAYFSVRSISNLFVNLRCMQIKDNNAYIYIGGGITTKSDPEAEWQETVSKAMTMKNIL